MTRLIRFFFFSSRRRHTRCGRDWSSDVCSSDLSPDSVRLVVQRVSRAGVRVGGESVAEIGTGLLVLVGVGQRERAEDVEWLAQKVASLRVFEDQEGKMNRSLDEVSGEILVVPQFTLYGDASKGRRPSWARAAPP